MPHYYFHIRNGLGFIEDREGMDVADLDAAHKEAVKGARSLIASEVLEGRLDLSGAIEVTDNEGQPVLTIPYQKAVST
jgi:hypothetical protein